MVSHSHRCPNNIDVIIILLYCNFGLLQQKLKLSSINNLLSFTLLALLPLSPPYHVLQFFAYFVYKYVMREAWGFNVATCMIIVGEIKG